MATTPTDSPRTTVFRLSCWIMGLVAFAQLMSAAISVASRLQAGQGMRVVEKIIEVPKIVEVRVPVPTPAATPSHADEGMVARPPILAGEPVRKPIAPEPTPVAAPPIADPAVEKLVMEARSARVAEDMGAALVKLNEAASKAPNDPNIEYELGLIHETMEIFDKAAVHYENVFRMGATKAGALYELAAGKLRDGIKPPDPHGKFRLGRIRIFRDIHYTEGERVVVTVPIQAAPDLKAGPDDFSVKILFYNQLNGKEIVAGVQDENMVKLEWVSGSIDWVGGEELLRATYIIPKQDAQQEHLFGKRAYYGQVVTLNYKNDVVDLQAWPRDLAAQIQAQAQAPPGGLPGPDDVPPEFLNTEEIPGFGTVLPPLPSR